MNIPDNLLYSSDHEWVRIETGKAVIGITDYAQDALGDVVFVELPILGGVVMIFGIIMWALEGPGGYHLFPKEEEE